MCELRFARKHKFDVVDDVNPKLPMLCYFVSYFWMCNLTLEIGSLFGREQISFLCSDEIKFLDRIHNKTMVCKRTQNHTKNTCYHVKQPTYLGHD